MGKMVPLTKDMENVYAKPARCPHCGYTPGVIQSDFDAYAQANCEHRGIHAKVTTAPLNEEVDDAIKELCTLAAIEPGDGLAAVTCDIIRAHLSDLTRRLAELEAERAECQHELVTLRHTLDDLVAHQRTRAESAEARVRELEATIDAMAEAHAHDNLALTAAHLTAVYRSGAHEGKKQAEAERDALRKALDYVIRDLEMRSNLKRGEDKGLVDIGDGAYQQAKATLATLAATEVKP